MNAAYMAAFRNAERVALTLDEFHCEVTPDGRPTPISGQWYLAVHPGDSSNAAQNCLNELIGFKATLTMRTGFAPVDRHGREVLLAADGLLERASALAYRNHMNYAVMNAANLLIPGTAEYVAANGGTRTVAGFVEPLAFLSMQYLGVKAADWFFAEGQDKYSGLAVELRFGRARRVQANAS